MITELAITLGAGGVGTIVGFFTCAALTAGKVADFEEQCEQTIFWYNRAESLIDECGESEAAHARCSDSRNVLLRKIEDIRELLNRPRTIRKGELSAILDGDA